MSEPKKITLGLIVSWVLGVSSALSAVVHLGQNNPGGFVVSTIAALLLLPPVTEFVIRKWNFKLSWPIKLIVILVLAAFLSANTDKGLSNSQTVNTTVQSTNVVATTASVKPSKDYLSMSCESFHKDFGLSSSYSNLQKEDYFKKQYQGKYVKWSGKVEDVSEGIFGGITVQVKCLSETFTSDAIVSFDADQKDRLMNYSKGSNISFEGKLDNWGALLPSSISEGKLL